MFSVTKANILCLSQHAVPTHCRSENGKPANPVHCRMCSFGLSSGYRQQSSPLSVSAHDSKSSPLKVDFHSGTRDAL